MHQLRRQQHRTWSFSPPLVVLKGTHARVAQLDRASGYEPEGREFESLRAHHSFPAQFERLNATFFAASLRSILGTVGTTGRFEAETGLSSPLLCEMGICAA